MSNEVEDTLVALADPVTWQWGTDASGDHWQGTSAYGSYTIRPGAKRTDFDATTFAHACCLDLHVPDRQTGWFTTIASVAEGKALCLRHAVTGDVTEIAARAAATRTVSDAFGVKKRAADADLVEPYNKIHVPRLTWHLSDPAAGVWRATGKRGNYTARFDTQRRWVVTLGLNGQTLTEQTYLTRTLAVMGCAYHAHTGEWRGIL